MYQHTWTLERFRRSGRSHLASAQHLLDLVKQALPATHAKPHSAAYLAHVAVECALKALLLSRNGCASKEELELKHPKAHAALFHGKSGHDLKRLAEHLRLGRFMGLSEKAWSEDDCWKRIVNDDRPYSLRYGAEEVSAEAVEEELERVKAVVGTVLGAIRTVRLAGRHVRRS